MQYTDDLIPEHVRTLGHQHPEPLAIGMQGAVFRLGDHRIAKVWFHAPRAELERLQNLYAELQLPFHTPEILEIHQGPRWLVTIEAELPGRPLHELAPEFGTTAWHAARDCVIDVLAELATVPAPTALFAMTVLDEPEPFRRWRSLPPEQVDGLADELGRDRDPAVTQRWRQSSTAWLDALSALLTRRVATYRDQLDRLVDKFDTKFDCLQQRLHAIAPAQATQLVHGDVTAGNILVDDQLRPISVLDFGLLSMAGDPVFDAASAAALYALWSPDTRAIEADFDAAMIVRLGYDAADLLTYRAVHALLIGNAHDNDPFDRDSGVPLTAKLLNDPQYTEFLT
ncbi:phosphotransferase family protein [Kribbella lupini]|uniref:Aminoglycoside phosphotransferase domain-containing protein n=1 Tax=Kribbella lupini TaxID=291602 RepID=A0ABP4MJQ1_9ACTN